MVGNGENRVYNRVFSIGIGYAVSHSVSYFIFFILLSGGVNESSLIWE